MTAERLEKWLKAATHQAAQDDTVYLDLANSRSPHDLLGRWGTDKADLHPLHR
jgi:hypothetical protein